MIETNRPSHSDTKKLDHFNEITLYLLINRHEEAVDGVVQHGVADLDSHHISLHKHS